MNDVLFEVLKFVIIAAIIIGMGYIVPWIRDNTKLAKNQLLMDLVNAAVQYAEQTIKEAPGSEEEKKLIVTKYMKELLMAKKISISDEQLNVLIESAVYAMNVAKKTQNFNIDLPVYNINSEKQTQ